MDTEAAVKDGLERIRSSMPETYKAVQAKAALVGTVAYALVRRALRGEANCFWACERGYVVGTPFADQTIERDIAQLLVQFGGSFCVIWGKEAVAAGGANGAH